MRRKLHNRILYLFTEKERQLGRKIQYKEVAESTGLAKSIISRWMSGNIQRFDTDVLEKLGDYFECDLQDILYFEMVEDSKPTKDTP